MRWQILATLRADNDLHPDDLCPAHNKQMSSVICSQRFPIPSMEPCDDATRWRWALAPGRLDMRPRYTAHSVLKNGTNL